MREQGLTDAESTEWCALDYRDGKYVGKVTTKDRHPRRRDGPGILMTDDNHCILSRWNQDQMDPILSLFVTSTGGILDISGEGQSLGIKYVDTLARYVLTGNIDSCYWIMDDVGGSGEIVSMKMNQCSEKKMQILEYKVLQEQSPLYKREQEYEWFCQKSKRILDCQKSTEGYHFSVTDSKHFSSAHTSRFQRNKSSTIKKQLKIMCNFPSSINIFFHGEDSGGLDTLPVFQSTQFVNSENSQELGYQLWSSDSQFQSEDIDLQCEQIIMDCKYHSKLNRTSLKAGQNLGKGHDEVLNYENRDKSMVRLKMDRRLKDIKKKYHLRSPNFINESNHSLGKAVNLILLFVNKVYEIYKTESLIRWAGSIPKPGHPYHPDSSSRAQSSHRDQSSRSNPTPKINNSPYILTLRNLQSRNINTRSRAHDSRYQTDRHHTDYQFKDSLINESDELDYIRKHDRGESLQQQSERQVSSQGHEETQKDLKREVKKIQDPGRRRGNYSDSKLRSKKNIDRLVNQYTHHNYRNAGSLPQSNEIYHLARPRVQACDERGKTLQLQGCKTLATSHDYKQHIKHIERDHKQPATSDRIHPSNKTSSLEARIAKQIDQLQRIAGKFKKYNTNTERRGKVDTRVRTTQRISSHDLEAASPPRDNLSRLTVDYENLNAELLNQFKRTGIPLENTRKKPCRQKIWQKSFSRRK